MQRKLVVAGLAFIIGSCAPTIAEFFMYALSQLCGSPPPTAPWVAQAGIVLMAVGFVGVLFLRAQAAYHGKDSSAEHEVATYVVASLLGGLAAIGKAWLEAKRGNTDLPWSLFEALVMFGIVLAVFMGIGYTVSRRAKSASVFASVTYKMTMAALIAGGAGILIQLVFLVFGAVASHGITDARCTEHHLSGLFRYGTTSFFLSAPMTASLFALYAYAWITGIRSQTGRVRALMLAGALLLAGLLVSVFALWNYNEVWPATSRIGIALALQMPSVAGAILMTLLGRKASVWIPSTAVAIVGLVLAYLVARSFLGTENMTAGKAVMFSVAHGATAFFTVFGVIYASRRRPAPPAAPVVETNLSPAPPV